MAEDDGAEVPAVIVFDEVLCGVGHLKATCSQALLLQEGLVQSKDDLGLELAVGVGGGAERRGCARRQEAEGGQQAEGGLQEPASGAHPSLRSSEARRAEGRG